MDQIAQLARQSADGARESAQACQALSGLALDLQKLVSNFRMEHVSGGARVYVEPALQDSRTDKTRAKAFSATAGRHGIRITENIDKPPFSATSAHFASFAVKIF
jgi:hypothetical protein